jgi:hypothetical protein
VGDVGHLQPHDYTEWNPPSPKDITNSKRQKLWREKHRDNELCAPEGNVIKSNTTTTICVTPLRNETLRGVTEDWPESDSAIVKNFPGADVPLRSQIIKLAIQAHVGNSKNGTKLTDGSLARAIVAATTRKQWSPALYLTTLPPFIANQVIQHEKEHHE